MRSPTASLACLALALALPGCMFLEMDDDAPATDGSPGPSSPTPSDDSPAPSAGTSDVPTPPSLPQLADAGCTNGRKVFVEYAVDGDTLQLGQYNNGSPEHVRLIGIDTPESYGEVECYGPEASAETHSLIDAHNACLTYDPQVTKQTHGTNEDAYGRTLAYVFYGENYSHFLNAELVAWGYAEDYPYTDGAVFEDYLAELEQYARDHDLGMWPVCPNAETHGSP